MSADVVTRMIKSRDARILRLEADRDELRSMVPASMLSVMNRMSEFYGYPAADVAADTQVPLKDVRAILRALQVFGWAKRHPFYDEDSNYIRGSGYSLTQAGAVVCAALSRIQKEGEAP